MIDYFFVPAQVILVLALIMLGSRFGGFGIGIFGGLGVLLLSALFGLTPSQPPVEVMLIILSVLSAATALQSAGGLEFMVKIAEKILRARPEYITFLAPLVCYLFTFFSGTGHVAYALLPVIAEVSAVTGVRPERPLGVSVIASQQAITASPISAATVTMVTLLGPQGIGLVDILKICIPATLCGVLAASFAVRSYGANLTPEQVVAAKEAVSFVAKKSGSTEENQHLVGSKKHQPLSVVLFLMAVIAIVVGGMFPNLRPTTLHEGVQKSVSMTVFIQMVMLSCAAFICLLCKVTARDLSQKGINGTVFKAGSEAVLAIFGVAWMGDTLLTAHIPALQHFLQESLQAHPWSFSLTLFFLSIILYSQAATVRALMPLGIKLGLPSSALIAAFPAVNGYFFIPNYPTILAAIGFDKTGTTKIGKYLFNHSFMVPGMVATFVALLSGYLLAKM